MVRTSASDESLVRLYKDLMSIELDIGDVIWQRQVCTYMSFILQLKKMNMFIKNSSFFDKLKNKKSKKIFIDKMFDKNEFLEYFKGFLKSLNKDEISIKDLHELYDIYEADEKYYELYFFICSQFSEDKVINLKSFEKWNWDWFIFAHTYQMLSDKENNLELSELQKEKIKELCNKYLELADFENAIKYTKYNNSNRSWTTNSIYIY